MLNQNAIAAADSGKGSAPRMSKFLAYVINTCLYGSIILVPLFFLPFTLDVLELNKQTLLIILALVATTAWLGKALVDKKFVLSRAWLHLVVFLFALGWLITSLFSKDLYLSLVGNFGQMQWSFATIAAFVLFYFLIVNTIGTTKQLYRYIFAFLVSSLLVGLYGFLQLSGVFSLGWMADFSKTQSFNTIGTINALGVYMVIPMILAASLTVFGCQNRECILGKKAKASVIEHIIVWATLLVSLMVMIAVDFWVVWAAALFGLVLLVAIPLIRSMKIQHPSRIAVPVVLACVAILLLIFKTPINFNLPAEVSPSTTASWNIAKSVLQESPIFGTGPGTWIYDYAKYRSPAVNLSQFWTIRFERGISTFFTLIAMIGLVGMALWIILLISAVAKSVMHLVKERNDDDWQAYLTVFVGWATMAFLAFVYNYNFAHHFVFWFLLALLAALISKRSFTWDAGANSRSTVIISVLFIVISVGALSTIWLTGQRLAADAAYSNAVITYRNSGSIDDVIENLNKAVALNRLNDVYYRNLSQAYLIKASNEFATLSQDQEGAAKINQIVAASVDTAKLASDINPMNVDNWENMAITYQSISAFVEGADEFAIANFEKALEREPNNPVYSTEIGKIHILRADQAANLLQSTDEDAKKQAEDTIKQELEAAAESLNRAIQAKADFAAAHYFLGLVYERQGRTQDAITKLEQVLSNGKDVGVAFQLAILYYRNEQKDQSRQMFEQIVADAPQYANARWYLSALYEEEGKLQEALDQVKIVQETNLEDEQVKQRITYLESLISGQGQPTTAEIPKPVEQTISNPDNQDAIQAQPAE
ncbi:tetratricopeptide repeat protein [Patescibacteria group bacterium]|nr:tetratricopeptide repeat protein [Patescibacteria group bacterium]